MPLPVIATPNFFVTLPVSGKKVECRPYLVKEDKILMMAAQNNSAKEIAEATRTVINSCVIDPVPFDARSIPNIDADYLLINLRGKSVGQKTELNFKCSNVVDGKECEEPFKLEIDLQDVKLNDPNKEKRLATISLTDSVGIKLVPTRFSSTLDFDSNATEVDQNIGILYHSLDQIFDANNIYTIKDFTRAEFADWVLSLPKSAYQKLIDFIDALPGLIIEKNHKCEKCGFEHKMRFENTLDFF